MNTKYYDEGMKILDIMVGENKENYIQMLNGLSSGLGDEIVEEIYGKRYGTNILDLKTRQLITIALMIGNAMPEQIEFHIKSGLRVGLTIEEIEEMIVYSISLVGMPKALSALKILKQIKSG